MGPSGTGPGCTGPSGMGPSNTIASGMEPSNTIASGMGPSNTIASGMGPINTIASGMEPSGTGPGGTGPSGTGPGGTGPSGTGPNGTGPSGTGPRGTGPSGTGLSGKAYLAVAVLAVRRQRGPTRKTTYLELSVATPCILLRSNSQIVSFTFSKKKKKMHHRVTYGAQRADPDWSEIFGRFAVGTISGLVTWPLALYRSVVFIVVASVERRTARMKKTQWQRYR